MIKQMTIKEEIKIAGLGLHSGKKVTMTLEPAPENFGICYIRTDLNNMEFRNNPYDVLNTELCTGLVKDNQQIQTIEHLNSALYGLGIDNLIVKLDSSEIPIFDGSSSMFVFTILEKGIKVQKASKKFIKIKETVIYQEEDKIISVSPSNDMSFDLTINFNNSFIQSTKQNIKFNLTPLNYIEAISRARTFGFLKEIEYLKSKNLCLGGNLDNAIVVDDYKILNENLRYEDEFVRHKLLDLIGDFYLGGYQIIGHISAYKPGHKVNNCLLRKLLNTESAFEIITLDEKEFIKQTGYINPIIDNTITNYSF